MVMGLTNGSIKLNEEIEQQQVRMRKVLLVENVIRK